MRLVVIVMAVCIAGTSTLYAQKRNDKLLNRPYADFKQLHLGFSVGMHFQDLKFTHNGYITADGQQWFAEVPGYSPGFCVNVLADLRLHQHFNLRFSPGIYFGNKNVTMRDYNSGTTWYQNVKSTYVALPLDLKISGLRYLNSRPYVTVGMMETFDVGKKRSDYLKFNSADTYLTLGLGCDFYLPFFKLNPEIKFCFGLTDILQHKRPDLEDDTESMKITDSLSKVKSNMFILTFYFE
jgi:hypothetical protein